MISPPPLPAHPSGHPEGVSGSVRQHLHLRLIDDIVARTAGQKFDGVNSLYPNVADGVDGMNFITQCVASSSADGAWKVLKHEKCRA